MQFVPLEVQYIAFCAPEVPGSRTSKNMMNKDYELFGCFAPFRSPILVSMAAIAEVERLCAEAPCMVVSADGSVCWKCVHPNAESLNDGICFPHFMIQVVKAQYAQHFGNANVASDSRDQVTLCKDYPRTHDDEHAEKAVI